MVVITPSQTYTKILDSATKKSQLTVLQLSMQSVAAGFWVGIYGHCCTVFGAAFFHPLVPYYQGLTKAAYSFLFPGAFLAIIFTGSELFTGNTVTMIMGCLSKRINYWALLRVWGVSLVGNLSGGVGVAYFLSYLSNSFQGGVEEYLCDMSVQKVSFSWLQAFVRGVGCNALVCLALWSSVGSVDGAGKILSIWFPIASFASSGLEHIVANFYTLTIGSLVGCVDFGDVFVHNWIPVLLGNVIAGSILTGVMWWYNFHPKEEDFDDIVMNEPAMRALSSVLLKRAKTSEVFEQA